MHNESSHINYKFKNAIQEMETTYTSVMIYHREASLSGQLLTY